MVKGIYKRPIQTGYEGKTTHQRKEGEEWVAAKVIGGLFKMVRENRLLKYHQEVLINVELVKK